MTRFPMRVLHIISPVRHGGGESLITELTQSAESDPMVALYYQSTQLESTLAKRKIRSVTLTTASLGDGTTRFGNARRAVGALGGVARLLRLIRSETPDILHVHSFPGNFLIALFKSLRWISTPALLTRHSLHAEHGLVARYLFGWMMSRYECVSTVSDASKTKIMTTFATRKLRVDVVHNCVADAFFDVPDATPARRSVFLQIGRFTPTKNHLLVLEALARLTPDERLKIAVWFAGAGETEAQTRVHARRLGLTSEEVKFLGYVPHDRLPEIMGLAHFGLFPSISEGFGIGAAECLAAGRPVLALQTDVMQEVLGRGGICVPTLGLDDGFRTMIASGDQLRSEARQWATRYHSEHIRSQYVALYRAAMEPTR